MPLLNRPAHSEETLGDRSFSFASSSVWNSIPNHVRFALLLSSFMSRLKTYLFRSAYNDWTVTLVTVHMCMACLHNAFFILILSNAFCFNALLIHNNNSNNNGYF